MLDVVGGVCSDKDHSHEFEHSALVLSASKTDVAVLTPILTPRVLDEPVGLAVCLTPADEENCVVVLCPAGVVKDAARVIGPCVCIHTDVDRSLLVEILAEVVLVLRSHDDIRPVAELECLAAVKLALAVLALVGIVLLAHETAVAHQVVEGNDLPASVTAVVAELLTKDLTVHARVVAVDNLLLRERNKLVLPAVQEPCTLCSASSAESPAAAALALVLDRSHSALLHPAEVDRKLHASGTRKLHDVHLGPHGTLHTTTDVVEAAVLLGVKICILVETERGTTGLTVQTTDFHGGTLEVGKAAAGLFVAGIVLVVGSHPGLELTARNNSSGGKESTHNC